jgi:hypothetical protein
MVQIGGGLLSLSKTAETAKRGLHIVEAGLIFQEVLIIYFFSLTIRLIVKMRRCLAGGMEYKRIRIQVNTVQFSLMLITVC